MALTEAGTGGKRSGETERLRLTENGPLGGERQEGGRVKRRESGDDLLTEPGLCRP